MAGHSMCKVVAASMKCAGASSCSDWQFLSLVRRLHRGWAVRTHCKIAPNLPTHSSQGVYNVKKMRLNLEDLQVDSFATAASHDARGTLFAYSNITADTGYSCHCHSQVPGEATCTGGTGGGGGFPTMDNCLTNDQQCTWHEVVTCLTNPIAFPSMCRENPCEEITASRCPTA